MYAVAHGDIGRRVKRVREAITPYAPKATWLAKEIGVSASRLSNWEQGHHDPPDDYISKIAVALKIPVEVLTDETLDPSKGTVIAPPQLTNPRIPVGYPALQMRYAGEVPAGEWGDPLASEEFIDVEAKYEHPKRFMCRVVGMSCWPALQHDDMTIWHTDANPPHGAIVLAQRKGDHACTVKELQWDEQEKRNRLVPINHDYDEPADGDGWGVVARLVAVFRDVDGEVNFYRPKGIRKSNLLGLPSG